MFTTKIALVVRDDLQVWQKLNVTAFLMSGVVGAAPEIIGEPYRDAGGNRYSSLSVQPVIVLAADQPTLSMTKMPLGPIARWSMTSKERPGQCRACRTVHSGGRELRTEPVQK